jgi:membrane protein CcdC involved in cytochrome C biogenesis
MSRLLLIFFLLAIGIIIGWFLHGYLKQRKGESNHGF